MWNFQRTLSKKPEFLFWNWKIMRKTREKRTNFQMFLSRLKIEDLYVDGFRKGLMADVIGERPKYITIHAIETEGNSTRVQVYHNIHARTTCNRTAIDPRLTAPGRLPNPELTNTLTARFFLSNQSVCMHTRIVSRLLSNRPPESQQLHSTEPSWS